MSFRYYPLYVKGNPQLRIFLPNFWMKLVKPATEHPPNSVNFIVPLEMTKYDVKNYLEKIYNVPVVDIRTHVFTGKIKKSTKGYLIKEDDYRMAYVTMPTDQKFEFPDLFPEEKLNKPMEDDKRFREQTGDLENQKKKNWDRQDVPAWFGI